MATFQKLHDGNPKPENEWKLGENLPPFPSIHLKKRGCFFRVSQVEKFFTNFGPFDSLWIRWGELDFTGTHGSQKFSERIFFSTSAICVKGVNIKTKCLRMKSTNLVASKRDFFFFGILVVESSTYIDQLDFQG